MDYITTFEPGVPDARTVARASNGAVFSWVETLSQQADPFFDLAPVNTLGGARLVDIPAGNRAAFEEMLHRSVKSKK